MLRKATPYFWAMLAAPVLVSILIRIHGFTLIALLYVCFTLLLLALSALDCDRMILPDALTLPGAALALAASSCLGLTFSQSLAGAVVGGVGFWLVARLFPQSLGLGDAKLMFLLGALCGLPGLPVTLFVSSAVGLATALVTGRKRLPFGPFLSLGAYLHMVDIMSIAEVRP